MLRRGVGVLTSATMNDTLLGYDHQPRKAGSPNHFDLPRARVPSLASEGAGEG